MNSDHTARLVKSVTKIPSQGRRIKKQDSETQRKPLQTLVDKTSNVQNDAKKLVRSHSFSSIDTGYIRKPSQDYQRDFDYEVFRDEKSEDVENKDPGFDETLKPSQLDTPKAGSSHSTKSIKKSLKRPHSRQLQGQFPNEQERPSEEGSSRRRFFNDVLLASPGSALDVTLSYHYSLDVFPYLLDEEKLWPYPTYVTRVKDRACALNWLIDINGKGIPAVVETATWYLDSILEKRRVVLEDLPVAVAGCFWIARKIHGSVKTGNAMVRCFGNVFSAETLCRVELGILKILKFPKQPILPQNFITYLAWKCGKDESEEIELASTYICTNALIINVSMSKNYPSLMAAAAVKNALLLLKKQHLREIVEKCFVYLAGMIKGDFIGVCMAQIKLLKVSHNEDFDFLAPRNVFRDRTHIFDTLKTELDRLYSIGGEQYIRQLLKEKTN